MSMCLSVSVCVDLSSAADALPRQHSDDAVVAMDVDNESGDSGDEVSKSC